MGEMADIHIQDGLAHMCQGCGRDPEWCECTLEIDLIEMPKVPPPPNPPTKHMDGCPGKPVRRRNRFTGEDFMGSVGTRVSFKAGNQNFGPFVSKSVMTDKRFTG